MFYLIFLIVSLVFVLLVLFVNFSGFLGFILTRVPYVRTYRSEIKFIAEKLSISSNDIFYDLGSGDGRVVFLINKLSGATCVGYELTWWTHLLAKLKLVVKGQRSNVEFKNQNFFKHSWNGANYIYGYLYPPLMGRVEEKFLTDCKPGSVAIIRDFPFPNLKPLEICNMPKKHEIYIYKKM